MAFKDIHKLKKIVEIQKEFIAVPHLVVGKDMFAVTLYRELVTKYGTENVRLLSEDQILLSDSMIKGPGTIRGEENKKVIHDLFPESIVKKINKPSIFYKDMTWKAFGGRSKPEALKFDEEFFTSMRYEIPLQETENIEDSYLVKIKSITRKDDRFLVECINGTEFSTEKLYFGKSPYHYMHLFQDKSSLSDRFIQFCESTQTSSALFVKFVFSKPISDIEETMFIPLSYTHEWGHFVGEFKTANDKQSIEFLHFIDEDHTSEEDISRTIRQLKKSLEKIFENFLSSKIEEYIAIEHEIGCLKVDDKAYNECLVNDTPNTNNLFFIGISAPISTADCMDKLCEYSASDISFLARALLVQNLLQKKI
jgi:hypothetical protein